MSIFDWESSLIDNFGLGYTSNRNASIIIKVAFAKLLGNGVGIKSRNKSFLREKNCENRQMCLTTFSENIICTLPEEPNTWAGTR